MTTLLRFAGVLTLGLAGIWVWMFRAQEFDPPCRLPAGFRSPVVALELVRSPAEVESLLCDPMGRTNRNEMREQIRLDWPFIVAYGVLFSLLGAVLMRCGWPGARFLGFVVIIAALSAAQWDVFEDMGILLVLDTPSQDLSTADSPILVLTPAMTVNVRNASLVKWGMLAVVEVGLAVLFLAFGRGEWPLRLCTTASGLGFAAAGVLGFGGLYWNPALEWSSLALALGLLAALPIFFVWPSRFLAGIGAVR